jgi:hypothetical protein
MSHRRFAEPLLSSGLGFATCCGSQQAQTLEDRILIAFFARLRASGTPADWG